MHFETSRRSFATLAMAATAALVTSACGGRAYHLMQAPQLEARVAQFAGADGTSLVLRMELQAFNPNPYDVYAQEMTATLAFAGQPIAVARLTFQQILPAQRPLPMVSNVALPRRSLLAFSSSPVMAASAGGPAELPFSVQGEVTVVGPRRGQQVSIPFSVQGAVARQLFVGMMSGPTPTMVGPATQPMPMQPMVGGPSQP